MHDEPILLRRAAERDDALRGREHVCVVTPARHTIAGPFRRNCGARRRKHSAHTCAHCPRHGVPESPCASRFISRRIRRDYNVRRACACVRYPIVSV